MITKSIKEGYLFELARTCSNAEKFKNVLEQFEKQSSRLDENNNPTGYPSLPQNVICNLRDADGRTLLHHCVANYTDQQACCQLLIKNYPQLVLTPDYQGYTIIHLAVLDGNTKLLRFLCTKGKQLIDEPVFRLLLQSADNELHSALHWSVICQEYACLEVLIETAEQLAAQDDPKSKDKATNLLGVNMRDIHGATCLHYASMLSPKSKFFDSLAGENKLNRLEPEGQQRKRSDSGVVDGSLSSGAKIETAGSERNRSAEKRTALKMLSKILHSKNVQVNCRDNDGRTPLLWAARLGESKAVKELLAAGADVAVQDNEGRTAMHCAANKGDKTCIETLFKHGNASINAEDKHGAIPLHYAAKFGSVDACRTLLNLGSFVDATNFRGQSVLHCAASKGQYWTCRTLVEEFDADLWKRDAKGELPLHNAVRSGNKELVKWILSLNPSAVNVGNSFGRTSLHLASQTNSVQLCKLLIDCGASVNALMKQRNFNEHLYQQVDELTRKTYLRTSRREKFGISMVTPLDLALQRNFRNCAHFLVMNGAFPAAKLGLNNILSKSNPNIYLEPDERDSKDSNESTFDNDLLANDYLDGTTAQSPYSASVLAPDDQLNSLYNKQSELRVNEKLRKTTAVFGHSQQAAAELAGHRHLADDPYGDPQKRSHSQPVFANEKRSTSTHHFVHSENGYDINQYALVQNSSGSSILDYSVDDLTKTQSIVTNVYLNCSHGRRGVIPIRKRKLKLVKSYSSHRNLNHELAELEERTAQQNQYSSSGNLRPADVENVAARPDKETASREDRLKKQDSKGNLAAELLSNGDEDAVKLNDDLLSSAGSYSVTELKNLKSSDSILDQKLEQKLERPTGKLNQLREDTRRPLKSELGKQGGQPRLEQANARFELSRENEEVSKADSRCSHYLHYKPDVYTAKYSLDYSHVKPKVDTRNNIAYLKSNLLRSKSNLEDLALEELDEAGEIMQNAEKSLRKYQIERKLLQELQDLKRYQIRSSQVNEAAFVKRLAEQFRKNSKQPGMAEFFGPYTYKNYEKYLYDQLRKLSPSNEGKVPLPLLNIINMNVYDRHQGHQQRTTGRLKKMSKSSEAVERTSLQENQQVGLDSKAPPEAGQRKEIIEMPMKISSLNATRKEQRDERMVELRPPIDYAQTDENETLQDISTSFSEEKFDSMPEQMNSEAIRKQFHEAFKSMSVVNEEASDQESSLMNEDKKTEVEKTATAVQQAHQTAAEKTDLVQQAPAKHDSTAKQDASIKDSLAKQDSLKKKESLVKQDSSGKQPSDDKADDDGATLKTSFQQVQQVQQVSQTVSASREAGNEEKLAVKAIFQQVNTINQTVNAFKEDRTDEQSGQQAAVQNGRQEGLTRQSVLIRQEEFSKPEELKESRPERPVDENNNELLADIIITNVTNVQKMFTSSLIQKEQSELINKGWVLVESIKEIDEKEDELRREETTVSSSEELRKADGDLKEEPSKDTIKQQESKESVGKQESIKKQESKETMKKQESVKKQESKGSVKTQDSKEWTKKQQHSKESVRTQGSRDSINKQDSREGVPQKDPVKKAASSEKISLKEKAVKVEKAPDQSVRQEQPIKASESRSLEKIQKSKSEDSSDRVKANKLSSTSSSTSSLEIKDAKKDSKIPKLGRSIKLASTSSSTSSTPLKSIGSSSKSSSSKSSPIRKSKTFVLQSTTEEKRTDQDKTEDKTASVERKPSLDKVIIFEEESVPISRVDDLNAADLLDDKKKEETKPDETKPSNRRLSVVCFPQIDSLEVEKEGKKRYVKTPIKQLSFDAKEDLNEKLNDEELSVPTDDKDDDSLPQSLNEELVKEQIRKEKNDLIENIEKKLREESIKQIKRTEETALRKVVSEERKVLGEKKKATEQQRVGDRKPIVGETKSEEQKVVRQESKSETKSDLKSEPKEKKEIKFESTEKQAIKEHQKSLSKDDKLEKKESKSDLKEEDKRDEKQARADSKSEVIYKSIEVDDVSERTAYIENMLRTSGYTEKIIEKASEFINGKDGPKSHEDGVVEEVTVKLVKKSSKDYYNDKQANDQAGEPASKANEKKDTKTEPKVGGQSNQSNVSQSNASQSHVSQFSQRTSFNQQSSTSQQSFTKQTSLNLARTQPAAEKRPAEKQSAEKPASQLKKSPSLSKIPTLQTSKVKKVEISSKFLKDEPATNLDQSSSSFKRNCLKPLQTKPEPIEQAVNRPVFKRKKSDLPPKHSIQLNNEQIKRKWDVIKTNEKDRLQQEAHYSRLRRTTSQPVISNSFDLIYELNKMPKWAKESVASQKSRGQSRSNTTSIITHHKTRWVLEKIEKKEVEEVTTIVNDEESITRTSREESNTHRSETEETESSISGRQCSVCKKIIIPGDTKLGKRDLRKMLSDSALDVRTCRCQDIA